MEGWSIFAERVKEQLDMQQMTQRELADRIGVTEVSISRYLHCQRVPNANVLLATAKALGVSCDYLSGLKENE